MDRRMKSLQLIAIGVLCGIAATGLILLIATQPNGQPVQLIPPPTPAPLGVYVVGSVYTPGIYYFPQGSRVKDALIAAGGTTEKANLEAINLAAPLTDGSRVWVPAKGEFLADPQSPALGNSSTPVSTPSGENPLNINTATQGELELLPGIGPTRAQQIIAFRQEHGAFNATTDLLAVPGLYQSIFEQIEELITIGPE